MKTDIYNDNTYLSKNPTWHEEDADFKVKRIKKLLAMHPISFTRVCEVGCGSGAILEMLQKIYPEANNWVGYDISEDAISIAKKRENPGLRFEKKDITKSDPDRPKFDLMLIIDVIEHINDYFAFLDEIANKSRYFIFHVPLDMCVWSLLREGILIESKKRVGHIHNFTEDFVKTYFTKTDITNLTEVPIYKKKAVLLTNHPTGSYKFEGSDKKSVDKLVILNYADFWSRSKYLVIVAD